MSDLFGNHIVGFATRWLICFSKRSQLLSLNDLDVTLYVYDIKEGLRSVA